MKKIAFLLLLLVFGFMLAPTQIFGQAIPPLPADSEVIYTLRETDSPHMVGTVVTIATVKVMNLKEPEVRSKDRKKGTVEVSFIIDKNGNLVKPLLINSLGRPYDEEALRVVELIGNQKLEPGNVNGEPASVLLTIPFEFPVKH